MDPAAARFPAVPLDAGHYESWYLKTGDAASRRALWLRYTVHKRPGEPPCGSLWATLFDEHGPHAAKVTSDQLAADGAGSWLCVGEHRIGAGGASGVIPGLAAWELAFTGGEAPFLYLPRPWMYTAKLPRTKALSLRPGIRVRGTASVGDQRIALEDWPGMIGHNWGAEHAERWIWLHGTAFDGAPDDWLDVTLGRIRLGRWTTPWVANGCLSLGGVRHRLGGIGRTRATAVAERPDHCAFTVTGDGIAVHGHAHAPRRDVVGWVYSDPAGPEHHTAHCAIADMTLAIVRPGCQPRTLAVEGGATYELGMRERDHGIALQPFPDP